VLLFSIRAINLECVAIVTPQGWVDRRA